MWFVVEVVIEDARVDGRWMESGELELPTINVSAFVSVLNASCAMMEMMDLVFA